VLVRDSKGTPSKKRKQVARTFTLHVNGRSVRICKAFFITTLGIGRKTVETALGKKNRKNISSIKDKRGKNQPVCIRQYTNVSPRFNYLQYNYHIQKLEVIFLINIRHI
jgi:hypothetical protein